MKKHAKEIFSDIIFCGGGCILYSAAIRIFAEENDIAQGGATGVAMIINYLFPKIPTGVAMLLINIPLFVLAWRYIGGRFILKSFFVTVFLSVSIDAMSFLPSYDGDKLIACIFCGVLSGVAMALIFMRDLTSGGTDILARLVKLKFPHLSMGKLILIADFLVVITAGLVYKNIDSALYSLILIFVSSYMIDKILFGLTDSRTLLIISSSPQKIAVKIMCDFSRGVSILSAEGGYTGKNRQIILCALKRQEVNRAVRTVSEIDDDAFTIVLPSSEIIGKGFSV